MAPALHDHTARRCGAIATASSFLTTGAAYCVHQHESAATGSRCWWPLVGSVRGVQPASEGIACPGGRHFQTNRVSRGGSAGGGGAAPPGGTARSEPNSYSDPSLPPHDHVIHPDMLCERSVVHPAGKRDLVELQIRRGTPAPILHVDTLDAVHPPGFAAVLLANRVQLDVHDDGLPLKIGRAHV